MNDVVVKDFDVFMSANKCTRHGKDKDDISFGCNDGAHHASCKNKAKKFRQYYIM